MTTAVVTPSLSSPLAQATEQGLEVRPRAKNVSWATEDKLCQVRLFAAEDAPSLSGTVLQDLLQAKQTRFMHAVIPVSADDLPPGFEGVAAKRARLDTQAILAMVAQISWRCPEKFVHDPLWQVVAGDESMEIVGEQQREVRVLEAVYPRPSAIPHSPAELQETLPEGEDAVIPQIPLIPVEDEEEGIEEDSLQGARAVESSFCSDFDSGVTASSNQYHEYVIKDSQKSEPGGQSGGLLGYSSVYPMFSKAGHPDPELSASYFRNADPNVAAAAAAAYAVVKAKESGTLIDHDLLIKILSNPVLIETLTASNRKLKNQYSDSSNLSFSREVTNGSGFKINNEQSGGSSYSSTPSHMKSTNLPVMQGRQRLDSFEGRNIQGGQGWDATCGAGVSQGRFFTDANEQSNGIKGMPGQIKGTFGTAVSQSRPFPPRQDLLKELIQQHGTVRSTNEAQLRPATTVAVDDVKPGHDLERHRATGLGSRGQQWIGNNQNSSVSSGNDPFSYDRFGTDIVRPKSRRPCLYFNTPRGCRNGMNCNFSHDPAPEKTYYERTRTDISQLQHAKKPKVDTADTE